MLLTYGQPKYRLFLLCEGNGDGTGVHFLDKGKHKGYMLDASGVADQIKESVGPLRFSLRVKMINYIKTRNKSTQGKLFEFVTVRSSTDKNN